MTLIATLWLLCAGIAIALAALELLVASRLRTWRVHVPFVVMAVAAAVAAVTELASYSATAVPELRVWLKVTVGFQIVWWMASVWFFTDYAGVRRRWIPWTIIGLLVLSGVVHVASPAGITHGAADGLTEVPLPWGDTIALLSGPTHRLGFVAQLAVGALLVGAVALVVLLAGGLRGKAQPAARLTRTSRSCPITRRATSRGARCPVAGWPSRVCDIPDRRPRQVCRLMPEDTGGPRHC